MALPTTTDAQFAADVLASPMPVLVDFTAEWCGPCRMVTPVLEQIAADEAGRLRVVALDVDANPITSSTYGVLGMPTMGLFVGGELVTTVVGARPRTAILRALEPHLAAAG
ncbi:thioredoxin family protein [Motilibacter deserti]|uniref:Thioredoxin n=1 Tax=Motilibacter deserti TaxID=2714956 RepID=A0ABX0GQS2_9ACTN|nr:thioredoxin domain-containing protein [Motilibacter deserti]NHC13198.1 thiol reductase thioredoxin [Motilibacter deserti]